MQKKTEADQMMEEAIKLKAQQMMQEQIITVSHAGDLGDLIAHLNTISRITQGRADLVLHNSHNMVRAPWTPESVERVKSFLELQPYIWQVRYSDNIEGIDLNQWRRKARWRRGNNLSDMFASVFRMTNWHRTDRWLSTDYRVTAAPVVIHRSPRYHGDGKFPWSEIVRKWGDKAVFCGGQDEWEDFCTKFGTVAYYPTPTLLDLARVIDGAKLFIGNQSSPYWIATALQQTTWLEESARHANCKWERWNAYYGIQFPPVEF
jgi:hypothetical protein